VSVNLDTVEETGRWIAPCHRVSWTMRVLGLVFAGTATERRAEMAAFAEDVLGLGRAEVGGVEADLYALPDGSHFAIADPGGMGDTERSIGFRVESLRDAVLELRAAGIAVDDPAENDRQRYVHFRAPDGRLYELVEDR
jgi:catechol 2,3-dioxygenase-like lactoylglutathione lyase family enzyme